MRYRSQVISERDLLIVEGTLRHHDDISRVPD